MKNIGLEITNPYHDKFPEISKVYSGLRAANKFPWYGNLLLKNFYKLIGVSLILIILSILWVLVWRDIQIQNIEFGVIFLTVAGCYVLILGLFYLLLYFRYRILKKIKTGLKISIAEAINTIPESTWLELTILLRDLAKTDPYMSADPDGPHTKISHRLALELLSNPSPRSKLNAIEYLFADYPDAGDSWINPFTKDGITMETYCRYLAQVLRRNRSEDLKKAMIMKKTQAEEKLANLSQSEDLPA